MSLRFLFLPRYLLKKPGDQIEVHEVVAKRMVKKVIPKVFRSPVEGTFEKILPSGSLLVREKPELARELTTVNVAKEMGMEPRQLKPYIKVEVGQEVDRGQWLASRITTGGQAVAGHVLLSRVSSGGRNLRATVRSSLRSSAL